MQQAFSRDQVSPHAGSFANLFNRWLPSNGLNVMADDAEAEGSALLGELKQRFNGTVLTSKSLLPATKGELQQQANEIDSQNRIVNQLVKQVNALTPVSRTAKAA